MEIGEGYAGEAPNVAHTNTIVGPKDGAAGTAWATALATPRPGHTPFVVVAQPNVPVQPPTLFVNKATVDPANARHAQLTWGAAQAGVAAGALAALRDGVLPLDEVPQLVVVAAVWVDPAADDEEAIYANNAEAMHAALARARAGEPTVKEVLDVSEPSNPYFRRRG